MYHQYTFRQIKKIKKTSTRNFGRETGNNNIEHMRKELILAVFLFSPSIHPHCESPSRITLRKPPWSLFYIWQRSFKSQKPEIRWTLQLLRLWTPGSSSAKKRGDSVASGYLSLLGLTEVMMGVLSRLPLYQLPRVEQGKESEMQSPGGSLWRSKAQSSPGDLLQPPTPPFSCISKKAQAK